MSDPPLHTLCQTCHLHPPLYTCPRCTLRSCSLPCVQTHKRRADCSGVRDPTVYKPMRLLATPAGVDHDFNFLSKIERGVERSDKVIVEGGLVAGGEVRGGVGFGVERRGGGRGGKGGGRAGEGMGEAEKKVVREVGQGGVRWERLPVGMGRRKANGTSWSRKRGCLVWQVEWVASPTSSTTSTTSSTNTDSTTTNNTSTAPKIPGMLGPLSKILATTPLNEAYTAFLEESRRAALTPEEKAGEKRRRAVEVAERGEKRVKTSPGVGGDEVATGEGEGQVQSDVGEVAKEDEKTIQPTQRGEYAFYLHRPLTLSSGPTVLIPLRGDRGLDAQLSGKVVLEFPRVYVFPVGAAVPGGFQVEGGDGAGVGVEEGEDVGSEEGEGEGEGEDSETSSSGSSSEEEDEESEEESGDEDEGGSGAEAAVGEGGEGEGDMGAGAEVSIADRTDMKPEIGDVVAS